jgi:glutamate carboxypeptidase
MNEILRYCSQRRDQMVAFVRQLVELESPTGDKTAADRCGGFLAQEMARRGAQVRIHPQAACGDLIEARFPAAAHLSRQSAETPPVMLLGHYDTVWEIGTLARRPCRESAGRLYGPGVFDMKAGIAIALFALEALREVCGGLARPVLMTLNADEEGGSRSSRDTIEALAKTAKAVLVLEPALGTAVKTARKGTGGFTLKVTGVAAHAGIDFARGQNAILELARQIEHISAFTDLERGLTVSVGFVHGGTSTANVVPGEAFANFDVRIPGLPDGPEIEKKFYSLQPVNPQCQLTVTGGINRPPMERTAAVAALYGQARVIAGRLGFELEEAAVGGASDGNFTAALGIPTLDGLGAVGEGAHAESESIVIDWLPRRAALLAGMIRELSNQAIE